MILSAPNTTPPPVASNLWFNIAGYTLITFTAILVVLVVVRSVRDSMAGPAALRRRHTAAVVLIAVGVLSQSAVAVTRMIQFPRYRWGIATLLPLVTILAGYYLVASWQRRQSRPL